jgi:hypothetical protein
MKVHYKSIFGFAFLVTIFSSYIYAWRAGIIENDVTTKLIVRDFGHNQTPSVTKQKSFSFQRTIGGSFDDEGYSVRQTSDGGYITVGYTASSGAGMYDVLVIKLDSSGNLSWSKTMGGSFDDEGYCVQQTSDNGYIITGYTRSFGAGLSDVLVIKLDSSGNLSWSKTIGGPLDDKGYYIQQTSDNGYIITGYTASSGAGMHDVLIIKLDSSGNLSWSKTMGGLPDDEGRYVQQTSDNGYIITGYTCNFRMRDVLIIKLDSSGCAIR